MPMFRPLPDVRVIDQLGHQYCAQLNMDTIDPEDPVPDVRVWSDRDQPPSNWAAVVRVDVNRPENADALREMAAELMRAADAIDTYHRPVEELSDRRCLDCQIDISERHGNATRCVRCSGDAINRQRRDKNRAKRG